MAPLPVFGAPMVGPRIAQGVTKMKGGGVGQKVPQVLIAASISAPEYQVSPVSRVWPFAWLRTPYSANSLVFVVGVY